MLDLIKPGYLKFLRVWMRLPLFSYPPMIAIRNSSQSKATNSHWSHAETKLLGYLKSDLHKEALLLFNDLRMSSTPLSPSLLPLILALYLEKGPQRAGLSQILSYLRSTSSHPSTGLTPLLIHRAVKQRDTESLHFILDACFQNGVSIRPSAFTQAVVCLLTAGRDYQAAYLHIRAYLRAGSNVEEELLLTVCQEHVFSRAVTLEQSIVSILTHFSELGKCIRSKRVFETLAYSLQQTNQFSHVRRTYIINEECQACGQLISGYPLSSDTYSSLEQEARKAIVRMYSKQDIHTYPELNRFDLKLQQIIHSISEPSDGASVVFVDCLSVATPIDTGWSEEDSERINCGTLLRLVECVERELKPARVVLLMRRVLFWRYEAQQEMQFLKERASLIVLNRETLHSLYSLLGALQLKSRALLLTADRFYSLKFHFSPHLHTCITSWFLRHCLRFDITGIEPVIYQSSQSLWQPHFSEDGLHVPMSVNDWICARK